MRHDDIIWVPVDLVFDWHVQLLEKDGGAEGVRDKGLLESAMARPQNLIAYNPETPLTRLAASYGFGLANNHAFIDGNKRVAFAVMTAFLKANGSILDSSEQAATKTMLGVAAGNLSEDNLADWLHDNTIPDA